MFKSAAHIDLVHVPYKGNVAALTALAGGETHMMFTNLITPVPFIQSGRLVAIAVTSMKRMQLLPELPTIDEAGVKGYEMSYWFAAYVPAKTPPAVVARLHDLLVQATNGAAMKSFYATSGTDLFTSTPDELAKFQVAESTKWGKIIKAAGIQPE